jgi:hypothetical protein
MANASTVMAGRFSSTPRSLGATVSSYDGEQATIEIVLLPAGQFIPLWKGDVNVSAPFTGDPTYSSWRYPSPPMTMVY